MQMFKRAYFADINPFRPSIKHVLVELYDDMKMGCIFIPGYGWTTLSENDRTRLKMFPHVYHVDKNRDLWSYEGWWETNWRNDLWAWCYGNSIERMKYMCSIDDCGVIYAA